jgi:hypothetical protein
MLRIQITTFKVGDFVSWQRHKSLVLSPAFQRRSVWPRGAKSLLIDTVVKGFPMPIVFLREKSPLDTIEPVREVVDGQQRLRTLLSFIAPDLLPDFSEERDGFTVDPNHNPEISGKTFSQLPSELRRSIRDYQFSVHVLPSDTGDQEVLQIFARMNSTGFKLNEQELRNAAYFGRFKTTSYSLAYEQLERWRRWLVFSEQDIARMLEVEETSDLMITILEGLHGKNQTIIEDYYERYDNAFTAAGEVSTRFREVMSAIDSSVGDNLGSTRFRRRPLFNTLFTLYYDLLYGLGSALKKAKPKAVPSDMKAAVEAASRAINQGALPDDIARYLRGGTNHLSAREARLRFVREFLRDAA